HCAWRSPRSASTSSAATSNAPASPPSTIPTSGPPSPATSKPTGKHKASRRIRRQPYPPRRAGPGTTKDSSPTDEGSTGSPRACLLNQCFEPYGDRAEDAAAAVGQGELVVAGGQGAPLLEDVEGAFHDVAAFVGLGVVGDR